jgi:gamma-glutamyl-gamma-aminobutyrate hydrolase PuuD
MQKKPFIGLNLDFKSKTRDTAAYFYLAAGYVEGILRGGGIPVIVPIMEDEDDIAAAENSFDVSCGKIKVGRGVAGFRFEI